ncbi:MAG: AAA family ATPase ['Candidatus Kapabacteria' thiocyanatum]|uniref:AAA+ ATPase domain-containing protein n=1 Tax=Candidatus Kapaibacterium thiocyanatum TaxID=1895771 RepID=A0A1M3KXP5_9BACT|nr:AAA family ATPase ['Candidatus Kapabacteria' thiocyanatum]OJX57153.1 MAG: hypothetical protein BGO89_11670 ['Candidatus Kapabacteria' thiocyanatum]
MNDTLRRLKAALDVERAAHADRYKALVEHAPVRQRVGEGICWYPVRIRETGYGFGEYPFVVVERPPGSNQPHQMSGGKPAELFSMEQGGGALRAPGVLHWVNGNVAHIILRGNDHPEWLDEGRIGLELVFDASGFRDMEQALDRVATAEDDRLAHLRDVLLGDERASMQQGLALPPLPPSLNASQRDAIANVLSAEDVAIIHGPPGTGKTTTIVEAVRHLAARQRPILVCAPSNSAVDLLTERCAAAGMDVVRIGNLSRVDPAVMQHTLSERWKSHGMADDIKALKKRADEFRRMALQYKRKFGRDEARQRKLLLDEAKNIVGDARRMEEQVTDLILGQADVVTCTLVGSRNHELKGRQFGTVVIDEAGQGLDPAIWIPITRADRVVLAGDPHQLPPTVLSQQAAGMGLSTTLLERSIKAQPHTVSLLTEQYRMNHVIMRYSNDAFYGGAVTAHPDVSLHTFPDDAPITESLVFIDTSGKGWTEQPGEGAESLCNPGEVELVHHVLGELAETDGHEAISVGIISPYRGQVRMMQQDLQHRFASSFRTFDVDTVDSFQGSECDVIVISLVRSNDDGDIGFLKDIRRMNVAMTRARKKLVVIGDGSTIGAHPFYKGFMDHVADHATLKSVWEIMV